MLSTFSMASSKSFSLIAFLRALIANIPASVQTLLRSAPVVFGHNLYLFYENLINKFNYLANNSYRIFFSILIVRA
jgi:hypothetical protein